MKIRGNVLRILFGADLIFFFCCMLLPWAWRMAHLRFGDSFALELYWSFQMVTYPLPSSGEYYLLFDVWNLWFGPYERMLFRDFWFSYDMYYYGFTYEWIRIFIYQCLTVFFGILSLVWRWKKTNFMLVPCSFSILSVLTGLLIFSRFGYQPVMGLLFSIPSVFVFLTLFILRYALERRKNAAKLVS